MKKGVKQRIDNKNEGKKKILLPSMTLFAVSSTADSGSKQISSKNVLWIWISVGEKWCVSGKKEEFVDIMD